MDPLQATLSALPRTRWRSVLHVGAGEAALEQHAATQADRLWLVEGDPHTAARLALRCARSRRATRVVNQPVAPVAGPVRWHCYNVERLNGPLEATPLRSLYPRLQRTGTLPLDAQSFAGLLAQLPAAEADEDGAAADLLVLDLPGQAAALLDSVPPDALTRFGWIVVRTGPPAAEPAEPDERRLSRRLSSAFFVAQPPGAPTGAWSCTPWRQDMARRREHLLGEALALARQQAEQSAQARQAQERRAEQAERRAAELEAALQAAREDTAGHARRIARLEADAEVVARVHADRIRDLLAAQEAAREEARRALAERQQRIDALQTEGAERARAHEQRLQALLDERDVLAAGIAEHGQQAGAAARRTADLEAALADLTTRLRLVQAEIDLTKEQLALATALLGGETCR